MHLLEKQNSVWRYKILIALLLGSSVHILACTGPVFNPISSSNGVLITDLTPAVGKGQPPPGAIGPGHWTTRLMLATSVDGITFTRSNEIISDQAGAPQVLIDNDGRLRVYYVDFGNDNAMAVAIQSIEGGWAFRRLFILGTEREGTPTDPAVNILEDGRYRVYFSQGINRPFGPFPKIYSGLANDGIHFTREPGVRFGPGPPVFDPLVLKIASIWKLWAGRVYTANSPNGLNFVDTAAFQVEEKAFTASAAINLPQGGYRLYGHYATTEGQISAVFSSDGETWSSEAEIQLSPDSLDGELEEDHLTDIGVTVLPDNTYLMVYPAVIP